MRVKVKVGEGWLYFAEGMRWRLTRVESLACVFVDEDAANLAALNWMKWHYCRFSSYELVEV